MLAAAVATAAVGGLAACGDDDEIDDVDVDVTTDATDIGGVPGTDTGSSSDITTGGSTGDSTVPTPGRISVVKTHLSSTSATRCGWLRALPIRLARPKSTSIRSVPADTTEARVAITRP